MPSRKPKLYTIVYQEWEESERGWGRRPDGYTLHLTKEDCIEYVKRSRDEELKRNASGNVPDCYTFASGAPQPLDVEAEIVKNLKNAKKGTGSLGYWVAHLPKPKAIVEAERLEQEKKKGSVQKERERLDHLRKTALAKLTEEEKKVLGLHSTENTSPSHDPNRGWRFL